MHYDKRDDFSCPGFQKGADTTTLERKDYDSLDWDIRDVPSYSMVQSSNPHLQPLPVPPCLIAYTCDLLFHIVSSKQFFSVYFYNVSPTFLVWFVCGIRGLLCYTLSTITNCYIYIHVYEFLFLYRTWHNYEVLTLSE